MRSLRLRIGAALLAFGMATLVAVGGALWFVLRDLHRDAAMGSLAELAVPYVGQVRDRLLPGPLLRRGGDGFTRSGSFRLRETREFQLEAQAEIQAAGVSVILASESGGVVLIGSGGDVDVVGPDLRVDLPLVRGEVRTGATTIDGMGPTLYAATAIGIGRLDGGIAALVLARADDSAEEATADLVRALALAAVVLLLIGVPVAARLARSVSQPLRSLAAASTVVARGNVPPPLPTDGPSEVAHATEAFNAMAAEVSATREVQRQLLADVRHDLRTPLTVIGGFAEALRDGTASGASARRAADAIADEAARLERMLVDLDHLTDSDPAFGPNAPAVLDGLELAREAAERFAGRASARGQSLLVDEAARPAGLLADRDAVARILGNIVANALTHAPSPGGRAWLEVVPVGPSDPPVGGLGGWAGRAGVVLAVRDDGPGIPREALPHIFDRFYRADPARSGPGSGLGLAIVRDLADALGGRAFAENPASGGTRVGVVLPSVPGPG